MHHYLTSPSARLGRRLIAGLTLAALLGGCAIQGSVRSTTMATGGQGRALGDDLSGFLAQAPAGSVLSLAESPWGMGVDVIVDAPYFAASGRQCRRLRITTATQQNRQLVACERANGWESSRLVTEALASGSTQR